MNLRKPRKMMSFRLSETARSQLEQICGECALSQGELIEYMLQATYHGQKEYENLKRILSERKAALKAEMNPDDGFPDICERAVKS